ncbi:SURF1 family protein [Sphingomonas oryzagri]
MTTRRKRWSLVALSLIATLTFSALGIWQVQRRAWKLALIASVDERVHAPPVPPPEPIRWATVNAREDAYRHVTVHGRFLAGRDTLVQALTEQGAGFWVMTPLKTDQGFTVLINRGFVPPEWRTASAQTPAALSGEMTVTGLLRLTEPRGSFLRANQPASDRWYSRDVEAIARARGLGRIAPYFIDADAPANPAKWPQGGLTVVSFPNNHLVYALTWFGLAALSLFGLVKIVRSTPDR